MLNEDGISWQTRFTNVLCLRDKLWPNDYTVTINFVPLTNDAGQQNNIYEKFKFCFARVFQNSIFIKHDSKLYDKLKSFNNDIIDYVEAYDQLVGVQIYSKLNAIANNLIRVEALQIESWQGENLKYVITDESPEWTILEDFEKTCKNTWWRNPNVHFSSFIDKQLTWDEIGFTVNKNPNFKIIQGGK